MIAVDPSEPPSGADLAPTRFLDHDHPSVQAYAHEHTADATSDVERGVALFEAVRDGFRYDPYGLRTDPADFAASAILAGSQSWCVPKSILLTAAARAVGIPARLGFSDVKNHLQSEKLQAAMGTDLFAWHGYSVLYLDGQWRKASAAFNRELCERFGTKVLEFDGRSDSLLHPHDEAGNRHMEYVADRGVYRDLPLEAMLATFAEQYGSMLTTAADTSDEMFDR